jgi:hypothetical protein
MEANGARRTARWAAWLFLAVVIAMASAKPARAATTFTRGFTDDVWWDGIGQTWIPKTVATGARTVLLEVDWSGVQPNAPSPGSNPASPADPQYQFSYIDALVRSFAHTPISVAFLVTDAPRWAEAPGGPASLEADGAWMPNARALGQFAQALAGRYSGHFPDPAHVGRKLPRVRYYQAWGEANINIHLSPQWTLRNGRYVPASPGIYRSMLDAFYAGVKHASRSDMVVASGLGPYGDPPGRCVNQQAGNGCRIPPAEFLRDLLCLGGESLKPLRCTNPAHFDALAINPYEVGPPTQAAVNIDDVTAPDMHKLTRIESMALRTGRLLPRAHKQLWVTEFSYDSNPPNPTAISVATQARWLEQSLYVFWKQGVNTFIWYLVRDQQPKYNPADYYSGVYFNNGRRKPSYEAFRFPLVVMPSGSGQATAWGISPRTGSVVVQQRSARSWKTVFVVKVRAGAVFERTVPVVAHGHYRAVIHHEASLVWNY